MNLTDFQLNDLAQFTKEGKYDSSFSGQWYLYFVGRDNVHEILKYVLSRVTTSLYLNMFGFDDDELNQIIMQKVLDPTVTVMITLDKSQSGGVHEKMIIEADKQKDPTDFSNSFKILQSATHQISHTKGGVLVAQGIWFEGSTNWSASGEGTGISLKADVKNPSGFKAQNNTLLVSTNPVGLLRFKTQLKHEHLIGSGIIDQL